MEKLSFTCDYSEGAHPRVLERLAETNMVQTPGYGEDAYCEQARGEIRALCACPDADVHFVVGGTQANLIVISAILRPHQGVLCAESGHVNIHETGAIEATGHKVLPLPSADGKITAAQVRAAYDAHWNDATHEHIVQPGMVYISHPTELGTLYTADELCALRDVCRELGLPLYLDGARMAYALTAAGTDVDLPLLAQVCDAFYIGGTKCGALFGEAIVLPGQTARRDFRYLIKQRGGMLAKGRLLGLQFLPLLEDGLYFALGRHANEQAAQLREACRAHGLPFLVDSPTNQVFPVLTDSMIERLSERFVFAYWQRVDESHSAVRFCTSWATQPEHTAELADALLHA